MLWAQETMANILWLYGMVLDHETIMYLNNYEGHLAIILNGHVNIQLSIMKSGN